MNTFKLVRNGSVALLAMLSLVACKDDKATQNAGFSFPEECATCHGDSPEYPLLGAATGYEHSGHKNGYDMEEAHAYYSNGGGCQKCHTHEGFVDYVKNGEPAEEDFVAYPSQPGCFTCHTPHSTGDFELRKADATKLADGATFDKGKANLCANCHQSRRDVNSSVAEMTSDKLSPYFGPHHGPQGDIFWGTGGYEFAGKSYSSSEHKLEVEDGCVSCHMFLPEGGRYSSNASIGGHSFAMAGELHGSEALNLKACLSCHEDLKQVKTEMGPMFGYTAEADYDQDGEVELAQMEVVGLLDRLVNKQGSGLLQQGANPIYDAEGNFKRYKDESLIRTELEVGAVWNFKMFGHEDRSHGIHNLIYTVQVLTDTIAAMDPSFDTSNRPE